VLASVRFYCDILGFKHDWGGGGDLTQIASVSCDGHAIMLECRTPVVAGCVWIGISGVAAIWEQVRKNDQIEVIQRPTNRPWALELKIKDPDGNVLWFGTEPLAGVPFGHEPADGELHGS
jgi:hypothetical protein